MPVRLDVETLALEFLRQGPAHNQLLSPLTPYLCVCGNHRASVVFVPWEQGAMDRNITELRATDRLDAQGTRDRSARLSEIAHEVSSMLEQVDGLSASMARMQANCQSQQRLSHLEIVVSANELAMIPFELSRVPAGFSGSGEEWLSVQNAAPTVLTRRVRGTQVRPEMWPLQPRILFIWADPEGRSVPAAAHLKELTRAVEPWLGQRPPNVRASDWVGRYLVMLPKASLSDIHAACRSQRFTHVHILAHGIKDVDSPDQSYSVALHARPGGHETELVDGSRLAGAIQSNPNGKTPQVVTVASCDSGQDGDDLFRKASLQLFAHGDLEEHEHPRDHPPDDGSDEGGSGEAECRNRCIGDSKELIVERTLF